ncbi:MAG: isocitrate dehydrogenase [Candidatus Kapabacteria bacterium]|nr:isocitrate dehydrogenase [Candidatus Kapabacteria bacterium]
MRAVFDVKMNEGVNILIVRENIEDTYAGIEHFQTPNVAQCLKIITRQGSMAVIRYAFDEARKLGRKKVTCVHKANIHKITDGLFLEVFRQVAAEYTDIEANDIIVDNCCMQLVSRPEQFDVLVLPNLYGDIVSDLCAGIVGGLGVAPGGNIGRTCAVFEAVHGSAPDIAGKGLANPTAILLSGVQMLQYMGLVGHAEMIQDALTATLASGVKTRDLGGKASTKEFTEAVIANLHPNHAVAEVPSEAVLSTFHAPDVIEEAWELHGVDVFVENRGLPVPPAEIGPFTLRMISNRGTKVWPGDLPDILLVDQFQCRYRSNDSITRTDVLRLLEELTAHGLRWSHVELLHEAAGQARYSKAQGE